MRKFFSRFFQEIGKTLKNRLPQYLNLEIFFRHRSKNPSPQHNVEKKKTSRLSKRISRRNLEIFQRIGLAFVLFLFGNIVRGGRGGSSDLSKSKFLNFRSHGSRWWTLEQKRNPIRADMTAAAAGPVSQTWTGTWTGTVPVHVPVQSCPSFCFCRSGLAETRKPLNGHD